MCLLSLGAFLFSKIYEKVELDANPILKEKNALNLFFQSHKELRLVNDKTLFLFGIHGRLLPLHIVPFI